MAVDSRVRRFGEPVLEFGDPTACAGAVGVAGAEAEPAWARGHSRRHAIAAFNGVTIMLGRRPDRRHLADVIGLRQNGARRRAVRYRGDAAAWA